MASWNFSFESNFARTVPGLLWIGLSSWIKPRSSPTSLSVHALQRYTECVSLAWLHALLARRIAAGLFATTVTPQSTGVQTTQPHEYSSTCSSRNKAAAHSSGAWGPWLRTDGNTLDLCRNTTREYYREDRIQTSFIFSNFLHFHFTSIQQFDLSTSVIWQWLKVVDISVLRQSDTRWS